MDALKSANLPWNPRLAELRFVAAALVLCFHSFHYFFGQWQPHQGLAGFGWLVEGHGGVSLFFVLSGYLLMSIALKARGELVYGAFIRNRALRIFPLLTVVFVVAISIGRDAFRPGDLLYLLFTNLGTAPTSNQFITGAAWTIGVEFCFYLVFPFLARFAISDGPGYLLRLIGLVWLWKLGGWLLSTQATHMVYSTLLGRFDQFLLGMLAAQLVAGPLRSRLQDGLHGGWLGAAVLLWWALLEWQARTASFFLSEPRQLAWLAWPTVEALAWAAILVCYLHWRGRLWGPIARLCEAGGEISYSLYLSHGLVIYLLAEIIEPTQWTTFPVLNIALCIALVATLCWPLASLSYRTIEAPFLRLRGAYARAGH